MTTTAPQIPGLDQAPTKNAKLVAWVSEIAALTKPDRVEWCDGSEEEWQRLTQLLVDAGTFTRLSRGQAPQQLLRRLRPDRRRPGRGPHLHLLREGGGRRPDQQLDGARRRCATPCSRLFDGCMKRPHDVRRPVLHGPARRPHQPARRRDHRLALRRRQHEDHDAHGRAPRSTQIGEDGFFVPAVHTVGKPLAEGEQDVAWPCSDTKYIVHYPETREIWSYGSGYGGNALLGKKCFALRIASVMARDEGWMAEHMLILKLTPPNGEAKFVTAAFPSACGKTNLAMLTPTLPGWKVETVGDDIAWMRFGEDGRLYAINPEAGFFGVAPGTGVETNANAVDTFYGNSIFTNVALTADGDVWWEGLTEEPPAQLTDWKGNAWTPESGTPAAHPNARFTTPASQCPTMAPEWEDPDGVPISAILFGGRRATAVPLVTEAFDWTHGTFLGSTVSSETTAAAAGAIGQLRRDPFAMLPFCGYNMGDYAGHWLEIGEQTEASKLPRIYYVNWFRKNDQGKWLWPGFGENSRVLKWIVDRLEGTAQGTETPIGVLPADGELDLDGLDVPQEDLDLLLSVDTEVWKKEAALIPEFFAQFGDHLPEALAAEQRKLVERLDKA